MWAGVELREIRTFLTLADELHFGRTADRLGITPSRVSQTIRLLEARVGARLVDRTSRSVRLTPVGEQFQLDARPAYEQLRRAYDAARETATGVAGTLRLGMYTPIAGGPHLGEIVKTFHKRHAACRVQLIDTGFARDQLDWLHHDDVDMLAMRLPLDDPALEIGPILSSEERVLLVANENPLAGRASISYEELAGYSIPYNATLPPELMDAMSPPRTPSGLPLRRVEVNSPNEALMRVSTGEIVHPTVRSFLEHLPDRAVTAVPISDLPPSQTALVWLKRNHSAKIEAIVRAAIDVLQLAEAAPRPAAGQSAVKPSYTTL